MNHDDDGWDHGPFNTYTECEEYGHQPTSNGWCPWCGNYVEE